jgi:hypothetical protein
MGLSRPDGFWITFNKNDQNELISIQASIEIDEKSINFEVPTKSIRTDVLSRFVMESYRLA